jgi:hypothetical protein
MSKLKAGALPMRRMTICLTGKQYSALRFMAYSNGTKQSDTFRAAIDAYIASGYADAASRALSLFEKRMGE